MKINLKGLKQEMSTTGTGASFAAGSGEQIATPKAFKKRKDEIGEPFSTPSPSIPNRKSKVIDYKKLFQEAIDELSEKQFNPVTDLTPSQADAGLNTGYDMDTQDAASVLEAEVGDTKTNRGIKSTVSNVDPVTGQISWDIEYAPAFDSVYKEFDDLRKILVQLDQKTDDPVVDDIAAKIKAEFNRYRTHIRKNYPDEYKKFQISEANYKGTGKAHGQRKEPKYNQEVTSDVKKALELIDKGFYLVDNNTALEHKEGGYLKLSQRVTNFFNNQNKEQGLNEARYTDFKKKSQFRTPTQQLHMAVREIRRKIDEMTKVVAFTERMRTELKASNEGMSYLNRTRESISRINEKLQELNNRIKGLTE
jgi:hypothetical protein